jgi:ABC-2 type transport system ATP-binding protein
MEVVEATDGRARLRVDRHADLSEVAVAIGRGGDILSFSFQPPTLSELFRRAVAA